MFTRNIRKISPLTLAFGGLLISATASAADVQSQAQEVLTGHRSAYVAASEATPGIIRSTGRTRVDVQQQAAGLLGGPSPQISQSPATRVTLRIPRSLQSANRQFGSSQEMAQRFVRGIVGE
jgi:hypothetical protein